MDKVRVVGVTGLMVVSLLSMGMVDYNSSLYMNEVVDDSAEKIQAKSNISVYNSNNENSNGNDSLSDDEKISNAIKVMYNVENINDAVGKENIEKEKRDKKEVDEEKVEKGNRDKKEKGEIKYGRFKSYENYKKITCKSSKQYKLQEKAITNELGIREYNGKVMVAIGTGYGCNVGDEIEVCLEGFSTFRAVVGDIKSDMDTDITNTYHESDKSVIEFIVDTEVISKEILRSGDISNLGYNGGIIYIRKINSEA